MAHQEIDQGEDYLMRSCDVSNYVNLRWHVSKFETLRSGEVSLSAQFDDHGDYKYFSIDGKTSDYDACCGNPVQQGGTFSGGSTGDDSTVLFRVYCKDDNDNCGGEWLNFGRCDAPLQ